MDLLSVFTKKKNKWIGVMWHPERDKVLSQFDINLIKKIF